MPVESGRATHPPEACMVAVRRSLASIVFSCIVFCLTSASLAFGSASNIYITQNGSASGRCTSNVQTPAFFNKASNWGSGSAQIGPGTTVLLCGTFTAAAGTTEFTFQGSGSSASPVTVTFDTGALLQSNVFSANGAINTNGQSYLLIDGGSPCGWVGQAESSCNGTIQNLLNGVNGQTCPGGTCSIQQGSVGVYITANSNNVEVRNLRVQDMAIESNASGAFEYTVFAVYESTPTSNNHIHNNWFSEAAQEINLDFDYGNMSNVEVDHNVLEHDAWAVGLGNGDSGSYSANPVWIHDNEMTNWDDWNTNFNTYHTDGLHAFTIPGSGIVNVYFYNNYCHGALAGNATFAGTAYAYFDLVGGGPNGNQHFTVFNNVLDASTAELASWTTASSLTGVQWLNNTILGNNVTAYGNGTNGIAPTNATPTDTMENNIVSGWYNLYVAIYGSLTALKLSDYNIFYNCTACFVSATPGYVSYSFPQWQGMGFDPHSSMANPNLNSDYTLASGSPARGAGANLNSLCSGQPTPGMGALCSDILGTARPTSGNWDVGAYQYGTGGAPAPPTGLNASVQ